MWRSCSRMGITVVDALSNCIIGGCHNVVDGHDQTSWAGGLDALMNAVAANATPKKDVLLIIDCKNIVDTMTQVLQWVKGDKVGASPLPKFGYGKWNAIMKLVADQPDVDVKWCPSHKKCSNWLPERTDRGTAAMWRAWNDDADERAKAGAKLQERRIRQRAYEQERLLAAQSAKSLLLRLHHAALDHINADAHVAAANATFLQTRTIF